MNNDSPIRFTISNGVYSLLESASSNRAISGNPEDYTDKELEKLVAFSKEMTGRYDKFWNQRKGANLICIEKENGIWMRKRQTWNAGQMWSKTLDEALDIFLKQIN
jgi:hypothetical protein